LFGKARNLFNQIFGLCFQGGIPVRGPVFQEG
jgi:hypothetical protein